MRDPTRPTGGSRRNRAIKCTALLSSVIRLAGFCLFFAAVSQLAAQVGHLDRADEYLEAGMVADALTIAQGALRSNPRNPQAHLLMGRVRLHEGNLTEASKSLDFAVALDPNLLPEVAKAYLEAVDSVLRSRNLDLATSYVRRAVAINRSLQEEGTSELYGYAIQQMKMGEPYGSVVMDRLLEDYPDYNSVEEDYLFFMGEYFESRNKRAWAKRYYEQCAGLYPEGQYGSQARDALTPKVVPVDVTLQQECSFANGRLFVTLKRLELEYDSTVALFSFISDFDRDIRLGVEEDTELEGSTGKRYLIDEQQSDRLLVGDRIELRQREELMTKFFFPPLDQKEHAVTLSLIVYRCEDFRFRDLLLSGPSLAAPASGANPPTMTSADPNLPGISGSTFEVDVYHLHEYFVGTGGCSGTLQFLPEKIVFVSSRHSFNLPCSDVIGVVQSKRSVSTEATIGGPRTDIPTVLISGRIVGKNGKIKEKGWHFVAQDQTPPTLIVSRASCQPGGT